MLAAVDSLCAAVDSLCASRSVDAVATALGEPVPLGIPATLILDQLWQKRSANQALSGPRGLIAEWTGAEGHPFCWGQLIEIRCRRYVVWRVVPVALWEALAPRRTHSLLLIQELITRVQPRVRRDLCSQLAPDVLLVGCQGAGRRAPHALCSLLLVQPAALHTNRQWLAGRLLTAILPTLLRAAEHDISSTLLATEDPSKPPGRQRSRPAADQT